MNIFLILMMVFALNLFSQDVIHDAEYYILKAQNGEKWAAEDKEIDKRLADLKKKHGRPPNIVYILWDDQPFGSVGFPEIQKALGYETPNINELVTAAFIMLKRSVILVYRHMPL